MTLNLSAPDRHIYLIGGIVFAPWATHSNSKRGRIDKLMHPFTDPWPIVKSLPGASYKLEFALNPSQKDKKACLQSLSYSPELMPFQPLDGADSRYSRLYKQFGNASYVVSHQSQK